MFFDQSDKIFCFIDHQFLRSSEIEMDITDEVRRQTGIVFPADKIREQ